MREILLWPNGALSVQTNLVMRFHSGLDRQLDEMWETLNAVTHMKAMGLAANQVGIMQRMFIMIAENGDCLEFINPTWEADPGCGVANEEEGCLSSPGIFETVAGRSQIITVKSQDRNGAFKERVAVGLEAVCVQHEADHLNGIFWFERMNRNQRRRAQREIERIK